MVLYSQYAQLKRQEKSQVAARRLQSCEKFKNLTWKVLLLAGYYEYNYQYLHKILAVTRERQA